jgi:hypothetical protein
MRYAKWLGKFGLAYLGFMVIFALSSVIVESYIPLDIKSQPGLMSASAGFAFASLLSTLIAVFLILNSRYRSYKFALMLGFSYYGSVTFVMQLETWYFLSSLTVSHQLLIRLFLMGLPIAFLFIPFANYLFGRNETNEGLHFFPKMPIQEFVWKFFIAALSYITLYFLAGYFIAWQNPELRAFYGQPGEALPFLEHMSNVLTQDPTLVPFQILRSAIWVLCALPIIANSKNRFWVTTILVSLLFSVPQNIWHVIENPLMPLASVRLSHLIETAPSNFIFGVIVVSLFHQRHEKINARSQHTALGELA